MRATDGQTFESLGRTAARHTRSRRARVAAAGAAAIVALAAGSARAWGGGAPGAEPRPLIEPLYTAGNPDPEARRGPALQQEPRQGETQMLQQGQYTRLRLESPVRDIVVGNSEIVDYELASDRELLLKGVRPGRTNLILTLESGTIDVPISVQMDLGVLSDALSDVHESITAHKAPDREAVVLLGHVPLAVYAKRAEEIARRYLEASSPQGDFLVGDAAREVADEQSRSESDRRRGSRTVSVINLIRIEDLPESQSTKSAEEKILEAIASFPDHEVTVRRVMKGRLPDDEQDLLILEGTVPDQVSLVRVLSVAYKVFYGARRGVTERVTDGITNQVTEFEADIRSLSDDVEVIADEAGALIGADDGVGGGDTRQLLSGFGRGSDGARSGVSRSGLRNRIASNLGRAKAIELADGRLLSFIEVEDLPQVRVDIRLYEVNRTALFEYQSDLGVLLGDFDQPGLNAAGVARDIQGTAAARVGASGKAIQNALGFLNGTASNQLQISGGKAALDSLFTLLENEEIARSLAKPSLTVLSGETALFEVGGEVPIDQSFATNNVGAEGVFSGVDFIQFGIKLAIRPLVDEKDFVTIDFAPELTAPDAFLTAALASATGESPATFAFESRVLRTSARMLDGSTLLVGGLQQRNRRDASNQVPWLHEVPLLGLLFQGFEYSDDDLELVVMVRVSIVRDAIDDAGLWEFPTTGELLDAVVPEPPPRPAPADPPAADEAGVDANEDGPPDGATEAMEPAHGAVREEPTPDAEPVVTVHAAVDVVSADEHDTTTETHAKGRVR